MIPPILFILAGFVLLMVGANYLVDGSVAIANKLKVPPFIIGLTIVAFGTSAPEFVVSILAAFKGSPGIAVGNVVGSNIANILFILAVSAAICPIAINRKAFMRDFGFLMFVTIIFIIFAMTGTFTRWMGITMLVILALFIYWNIYNAKKDSAADFEEAESSMSGKNGFIVVLVTVLGLVAIIGGADLLVKGSVTLARLFHVSEEIIGLTIVALGTSLPELATSAVAAYRKQSDIAVGNVIGSNIWNIVFIMGATSSIINVEVTPQIMHYDIWVMFGSTVILLPIVWRKNRIGRAAGTLLLVAYVAYIISQIMISTGAI